MMSLPERLRLLDVRICSEPAGELLQQSQLFFKYLRDEPNQRAVGLLMPSERLLYQSNTLFPVMDQNLPEGYLFARIREAYPKRALTAMHLLALIGDNGIGRLGFFIPGVQPRAALPPLSRADLLGTRMGPAVFESLVQAYLSTGIGIAGVQPKILVPERATVPVPNLIVKAAPESYPGLSANEFLCLSVAKRAGIATPDFALSDDGQLLLIDRFDMDSTGHRLGFEDVASLIGRSVRDTLSDRKYQGSYEMVAEVLKLLRLPAADLERFFEQLALSVMLRNGDAHLKNFGVLYDSPADVRLSPVFDVVTTAIYQYAQYPGGPLLEDRTMALRLFRRSTSKGYPLPDELLRFGHGVCGVKAPMRVFERIAQAMSEVLAEARRDERIPAETLRALRPVWKKGMAFATS